MSKIPVHMYAWRNNLRGDDKFRNITETILVDPRGKTASKLAFDTATKIREINPNKIALRFWKELTIGDNYAFDRSRPLDVVKQGGLIDGIWQYWRDFFFYLEQEGITPDILIHDMEDGYGYWNIKNTQEREQFFRSIFNNMDEVRDYLPEDVANSTYNEFMSDVRLRISYHRHADVQMTKLLQRVFNGIIPYIYGKEIDHCNYKDRNMTFDVLDEYGNKNHTSRSITSISSPVVYIEDRTIKTPTVAYSRMEKHPRWNRLIEKLNICISCLQSGGKVIPWIAPPGYGRYGSDTWARMEHLMDEIYIWSTVLGLLQGMGISEFILWNPRKQWNPFADHMDYYMDNALYTREIYPVDPQTLTAIENDADVIKFGETEVRYDFFSQIL